MNGIVHASLFALALTSVACGSSDGSSESGGGSGATPGLDDPSLVDPTDPGDPNDPADPNDAGDPVDPASTCARPAGIYESTPLGVRGSNSNYTCTPPEATTTPFFDYPSASFMFSGETCTWSETTYGPGGCTRVDVLECTDGSSIRLECTSDEAGDVLECTGYNDLVAIVCTTEVRFTRVECPEWGSSDTGGCEQCQPGDCSSEQVCFGGACLTPCTTDLDCPAGQACDPLEVCL